MNFQNCKLPPSNIVNNNKHFFKNKKINPREPGAYLVYFFQTRKGAEFCFWLESKILEAYDNPFWDFINGSKKKKSMVILPEVRGYFPGRAHLY